MRWSADPSLVPFVCSLVYYLTHSKIYGDVVKNYSANETRRNDIVLGVSYADDLGRAIEVVSRVLADEPRVLREPEPVVAVA